MGHSVFESLEALVKIVLVHLPALRDHICIRSKWGFRALHAILRQLTEAFKGRPLLLGKGMKDVVIGVVLFY